MHLQQRIDLMVELGRYMLSDSEDWSRAKEKAYRENSWFIPEFIDRATDQIAKAYLDRDKLQAWVKGYPLDIPQVSPLTVGITMAGNIPLAGFHDFLSVFLAGQRQVIKPSSKDHTLIKKIVSHLQRLESETGALVGFADMLKGCDAYIATGSNQSARYFEYYFSKYPHIIRHNRTSVAILSGEESEHELESLSEDICLYFGLGCRNVTKIYVPHAYDFTPLLKTLERFKYLEHHNKYKNNFDYQLSLLILNNQYYMSNGFIILTENKTPYSPIGMLHFEYYSDHHPLVDELAVDERIQCIVGRGLLPFGTAQQPALEDYADGVNTLEFLSRSLVSTI
jgi:hypothetical protein